MRRDRLPWLCSPKSCEFALVSPLFLAPTAPQAGHPSVPTVPGARRHWRGCVCVSVQVCMEYVGVCPCECERARVSVCPDPSSSAAPGHTDGACVLPPCAASWVHLPLTGPRSPWVGIQAHSLN